MIPNDKAINKEYIFDCLIFLINDAIFCKLVNSVILEPTVESRRYKYNSYKVQAKLGEVFRVFDYRLNNVSKNVIKIPRYFQ